MGLTYISFFQRKCTVIRYMGFILVKTHNGERVNGDVTLFKTSINLSVRESELSSSERTATCFICSTKLSPDRQGMYLDG